MTTQGPPAMASAAAVYNWVEQSDGYVLRLRLPGCSKREDFSVCVDGKRRLTITADKAQLKKTFQLPKTAKPDSITGRFDGDKLTLTVPTKGSHKPAVTVVTAATTKKEEEEEPKAKDKEEPSKAKDDKEEPSKAKAEREKKLIDTAVTAFTLGVLLSHRLFSSRN